MRNERQVYEDGEYTIHTFRRLDYRESGRYMLSKHANPVESYGHHEYIKLYKQLELRVINDYVLHDAVLANDSHANTAVLEHGGVNGGRGWNPRSRRDVPGALGDDFLDHRFRLFDRGSRLPQGTLGHSGNRLPRGAPDRRRLLPRSTLRSRWYRHRGGIFPRKAHRGGSSALGLAVGVAIIIIIVGGASLVEHGLHVDVHRLGLNRRASRTEVLFAAANRSGRCFARRRELGLGKGVARAAEPLARHRGVPVNGVDALSRRHGIQMVVTRWIGGSELGASKEGKGRSDETVLATQIPHCWFCCRCDEIRKNYVN